MKRMQVIKAIGMDKQGVMVGKKEVHVERMLGESLIKKLIKI
jgi:hypothetical protein